MRRFLTAAGVDYAQWKALTWTALKLDVRTSTLGRGHGRRETSAAVGLLGQAIVYTAFGLAIGFVLAMGADLFFAATVAMSYVVLMVGAAVLLDHGSALASPNDYAILGFRPITSRTYFAVRLANVLAYTTLITTAVVWVPVGALFWRHGLGVGAAGVLAFYACSTSVALAILLGHATLMRVVGPDALKRGLSYLQLVLSFVIYGGYAVMSRVLTKSLVSFTLPKTPWLLLYPATWFASYLELGAGRGGWFELAAAALSVVALGVMGARLGGRLSLQYSERLGAILTSSRRSASRGWRPSAIGWFRGGEGRAVALLVRAQFRDDQRFRMGVLSIVPMTLVYLFMGVSDGALHDPFVSGGGTILVTMAILMFPSMVKLALAQSDMYRASWIFFSCPVDRVRAIRSAKNVLVVWFLVPYLVVMAALYAWFVPHVTHVVVHVALLGLVSHLCLQCLVLMDPELPFSRPPRRGANSAGFFFFMIVLGGLASVFGPLSAWLYASVVSTVATFAIVAAVSVGLEGLIQSRVADDAQSLEFEG